MKYVKIAFLSLVFFTMNETRLYAAQDKEENKKQEVAIKPNDENLPLMTINGTNESTSFIVSSGALTGKEITIKAPNGFTVTPNIIPANTKKQKVTITLNSTKAITEGKIVLRSEDTRSYIQVKGYGTAIPTKEISQSTIYKGSDNKTTFSKAFQPGKKGYTIEFKVKTNNTDNSFYPYFVNEKGDGFKAYITSENIGIFNTYKKDISNPSTKRKEGGTGKFYNNDGLFHTYRFAITPDNRAFIYRDGMPIDTVRIKDYAPQSYFADEIGEPKENLLKNGDFEGEFEVNPETKLMDRLEGWDIVIEDRWNSEQQITPEEIDKQLDIDNHVFEIKPYKWGTGWSDGILMQTVDVAPNETYTLSALVKGGISKKQGKNTGKMVIEEAQDSNKRIVTEIASDLWETYSMDYTTSADCKQIRISFTVGRGEWGNDINAIRVDNAKLTGTSRTYSPKLGFEENTAEVEYMAIDESGAYAPTQPIIEINLNK